MKLGDSVLGLQSRRNGGGHFVDQPYEGVITTFKDGVPVIACKDGQVVMAIRRSAEQVFFCRATGSDKEAWVQIKAPFREEAACAFIKGHPLSLIGRPISTLDAGAVWSVDVWHDGEVEAVKVKITTITTYEVVE